MKDCRRTNISISPFLDALSLISIISVAPAVCTCSLSTKLFYFYCSFLFSCAVSLYSLFPRIDEQKTWPASASVKNICFDLGPHPEEQQSLSTPSLSFFTGLGHQGDPSFTLADITMNMLLFCLPFGGHNPLIVVSLWFSLGR